MLGSRLLVEESIKEVFLEKFYAYVDTHKMGDSRDDDTTIAAMIHPVHVKRVLGFIERARAAGDKILRGGNRVGNTNWVEPTLIAPKDNNSEVVQEEIFGPVLTLQTFKTEAEAIVLANSTAFGLAAMIYTCLLYTSPSPRDRG